ncbi:hypothetical protein C0W40_21165 [Photobacterium leiognathi subsp. mandapamensis]|uniref:DMP19 family protein n=1 Tax=Photobacterium leiognathi TaxID=553611 RepID=UPI000D1791CF|nr:hypothetical protein C0W40_21165 [Photobacterium leiognathi subsp. mandapamensis]
MIGAHKTAKIAEKANSIFGKDGPSRDSSIRSEVLLSFGEKYEDYLGKLDDEFYEYPHDLYALLEQYFLSTFELASMASSNLPHYYSEQILIHIVLT